MIRKTHPIPPELLTPAEMARADALAAEAGHPARVLMAAAGRAVARAVRRRWRPRRVVVLCGPGDNGGDGWVAARLLTQEGWPVAVAALAEPRPGGAAAEAAARWRGPRLDWDPAAVSRAAVVVDAVFGAGLSRPVDGVAADVLRAIAAPVLAVDVPSGVDGGTGQVLGHAARAVATVSFARLKPGHLLLPGRDLCGEVELADIGLPASVIAGVGPRAFRNGPWLWCLPRPAAAMHKHERGHVVVAAGAAMPGAARLAAAAARRAGAGMLTVAATSPGAAFILRGGAMPGDIIADPPPDALIGGKGRVWVLGPGLPPDERAGVLLDKVLAGRQPVVADAGALTLCAGNPDRLRGASIVTPHAGEFARVFGEAGEDRLASARAAAARTGAVVVLKGSDTVIAAPDGRVAINGNAPAGLATAGTGDVLSGICGAFLAQGMPPFEAAAAAVWVHGAAAPAGPGLIAEDVVAGIPAALARAEEARPGG
ncbi:bifunctional ADP-dependent NAD(P)H-hydrate dehydratase/NAD(P)H-hydrate epimerase [Roseomonas gilardii]|uniref:bifunctional ADP-dependent NAD(P)H-hydrate dehydratase/NAD(P)H-hydrate epimerase n=1 Tax=Roseomonas gilardii TaxID=257708 RepID=UPI0004AEA598|nr:bifunctional ADP-dependent NAD(P)H-hydrate dehydratase/NAD(P)H-hydrate epimerase [Roseomonas gilardii]SUE43796.1 Nicotinamide nucleotide repair protein [Roseomonas gilardii subsp. rosea]